MMDFLKQDGADKNIAADADLGLKRTEDAGAQPGFIQTRAQEKNVKQGTIVLAILFAAGLLCLWLMVKKSSPQAATAAASSQDTAIEIAIAQVTGTKAEFFKSIEDIVGKFNQFSKVKQVKIYELQKNPFEHDRNARTAPTQVIQREGSSTDQVKSELEEYGRSMQLQSIMRSPQGNSCMIDDNVLSTGEIINGWKVETIADKSVELSSEGSTIVLTITSEG